VLPSPAIPAYEPASATAAYSSGDTQRTGLVKATL
jgi:hypothetical protein